MNDYREWRIVNNPDYVPIKSKKKKEKKKRRIARDEISILRRVLPLWTIFYIGDTVVLLNQRHCRRAHGGPHHATRPVKRHGTVTTWDDHGIQCTHAAAHCAPLDFVVGALLCHFALFSLSLFLALFIRIAALALFSRLSLAPSRHPRRLLLLSSIVFFCPLNYPPRFVRVNHREFSNRLRIPRK